MQFRTVPIVVASIFVPLTAALQTIYFGAIGSSAGPSECIAFFSDSDPCADGTTGFGYVYCNGNFCDEPITILGHQNITFTGCVPNDRPYPVYTPEIPTGVSDDGAPALTCKPADNPPGSEYGVYASCPPDEGNPNVGFVNVDAYCS